MGSVWEDGEGVPGSGSVEGMEAGHEILLEGGDQSEREEGMGRWLAKGRAREEGVEMEVCVVWRSDMA